jgi:hypothetical protein
MTPKFRVQPVGCLVLGTKGRTALRLCRDKSAGLKSDARPLNFMYGAGRNKVAAPFANWRNSLPYIWKPVQRLQESDIIALPGFRLAIESR